MRTHPDRDGGGIQRAPGTEILAALDAARRSTGATWFEPDELIGLPAVVQRYFSAVLREGQPIVTAVRLEQTGTFNLSDSGERWRPFTAVQRVVTQRPGFDWDARITLPWGRRVRVHDAYVAGSGILRASLFGIVPLVNLRGTPELGEGELMRFLAEAAWYPTALLPSQGVRWMAVDEHAARATLTDDGVAVSLLFTFGGDGLIESVRAEARGRTVAGRVTPTPWEGRWSDYVMQDGMRIPVAGEVAWLLPEGRMPYWRGRITRIAYETTGLSARPAPLAQ